MIIHLIDCNEGNGNVIFRILSTNQETQIYTCFRKIEYSEINSFKRLKQRLKDYLTQ